jgi:hypothetical protein
MKQAGREKFLLLKTKNATRGRHLIFVLAQGGIGSPDRAQHRSPQGVHEKNYIRHPLDLLRMWHMKIDGWMLEQADIDLVPVAQGLRVVSNCRIPARPPGN